MVVVVGETKTLEPETAPIPWLILRVGAGEPETDQDKVDEEPFVIVVGDAVKEEMIGAEVAAVRLTETV